jgi:hypothetical protein
MNKLACMVLTKLVERREMKKEADLRGISRLLKQYLGKLAPGLGKKKSKSLTRRSAPASSSNEDPLRAIRELNARLEAEKAMNPVAYARENSQHFLPSNRNMFR